MVSKDGEYARSKTTENIEDEFISDPFLVTSCQMKEMMEAEKKFLATKWKVEAEEEGTLVIYICIRTCLDQALFVDVSKINLE